MTGQVANKNSARAPKTYVCFILDKSGSMGSIREEARSTFNEQIQVIREKAQNQEVVASVTLFNGDVSFPIWMQDISKCKELTEDEYRPNGSTAMFDAIGYTIDRLKEDAKDENGNNDINEDHVSVLFITVSDGYENASTGRTGDDGELIHYGDRSNPEPIQNLIKKQQDTGRWTFTFLAANQDIMELSKMMGVSAGNTRSFASTRKGMVAASQAVTGALGNYFDSRANYSAEIASAGVASADSMRSVDFYSSVDENDSSEGNNNQ